VVAVVGLAAPPTAAPVIPVFRADRPFLFAIREVGTGAILFLGRYTQP
jgi:serine protease inhibitor